MVESPVINGEDMHDFCCPIILDLKHSLTKRLIKYKQLNHAGIQIVMSNLREMFLLVKLQYDL